MNVENAASLQYAIIADLKRICEDTVNFPLLSEMNFDNSVILDPTKRDSSIFVSL